MRRRPLGKQQWRALEIVQPGGVAAAVIPQVGREQNIKVIIGQCALLGDELDRCNTVSRWGSVTICFSMR